MEDVLLLLLRRSITGCALLPEGSAWLLAPAVDDDGRLAM